VKDRSIVALILTVSICVGALMNFNTGTTVSASRTAETSQPMRRSTDLNVNACYGYNGTGPRPLHCLQSLSDNLLEVLGPDRFDLTCQNPRDIPWSRQCKIDAPRIDAQAQAIWSHWTLNQRAAFLGYLNSEWWEDVDGRDPPWVSSLAEDRVSADYAMISACGLTPYTLRECPSLTPVLVSGLRSPR
jgi:hypothetical protein